MTKIAWRCWMYLKEVICYKVLLHIEFGVENGRFGLCNDSLGGRRRNKAWLGEKKYLLGKKNEYIIKVDWGRGSNRLISTVRFRHTVKKGHFKFCSFEYLNENLINSNQQHTKHYFNSQICPTISCRFDHFV